ncbi:MAG: type I DNA topoisomerase [Deltaproteobacteria bacterium]|nr:type I DNA topoisomerase [Deltaproteobacteria bacterium]
MAKSLVIVESPAKARTLKKYLGRNFQILASVGHIKDLPKSKLGVDVEHDFEPTYEVIRGKAQVIKDIVEAAKKVDVVYLAPDPDREGEAIAWHLAEEIKGNKTKSKKKATKKTKGKKAKAETPEASSGPKIYRAMFNEITERAVKEAIAHPTDLNVHLYEAQQARRILDRLVGYQISPLLWDKVRRGLSAGRVQSIAVRIICEREAEVDAFKSEEYWSLLAKLEGKIPPSFEAKLIGTLKEGPWVMDPKNGKNPLPNKGKVDTILKALDGVKFLLSKVTKKERKRNPLAPFITSQLQQDAARKLGFTAKKTMMLAQRLYEGVDMGEEGPVGLITYMRTDSTRISQTALDEVRDYIVQQYGKTHLPDQPNIYKSKKGAQDAHEAIRPTSTDWAPEKVASFMEPDMLKLYDLIWKRFVASQMNPAEFDQTTLDIEGGDYLFRATGSVLKFPGFMAVYLEAKDEDVKEDEEAELLPDLKEGDILKLLELLPKQHFTEPPPRYSEASLVKTLEELGIGRPSTYAAILSNIQEKEYVAKNEGRFKPTSLGVLVNGLLVQHFPGILNAQFTAQMEKELDDVEEGSRKWVDALHSFYTPFQATLAKAKVEMKDIKAMQIETDLKCRQCSNPMVIRWGRFGEYLSCSKYPECKTTHEFTRDEKGKILIQEQEVKGECEKCASPMIVKRGRFGPFLACTKYPECKNTKAIPVGVACPKCKADVVQRRSHRGKVFYGCSKYPACDFASWNRPLPQECPQCHHPFLVEKYSQKVGAFVACPQKECGYTKEPE